MLRLLRKYVPALAAGITLIAVTATLAMNERSSVGDSARPYRIVFIGASIGQAWDLPHFPQRAQQAGYAFEMMPVYEFDKSRALDEVLIRPKRTFHANWSYLKSLWRPAPQKPDAIVLKECSSYFPGDLHEQQRLVAGWVERVRAAGIQPILATVVPVTQARAERDSGKMSMVRAYNDWVRQYVRENGIFLLDLEQALRADGGERFLRDEYAVEDGSHLNARGYRVLDQYLTGALQELKHEQAPPRARRIGGEAAAEA